MYFWFWHIKSSIFTEFQNLDVLTLNLRLTFLTMKLERKKTKGSESTQMMRLGSEIWSSGCVRVCV